MFKFTVDNTGGFLQMVSRVRQVRVNDVVVFTNNLPYRENASFYTYANIKASEERSLNKYVRRFEKDCVTGETFTRIKCVS